MLCDGLDDAALDALITELTAGVKQAMIGGDVAEVRGEGRMMSYTRANVKDLQRELTAAKRLKCRRDPNSEVFGALGVDF